MLVKMMSNAISHVFLLGMILSPSSNMHWTQRESIPQPRSGYAIGSLSSRMILAGGSYWTGDVKHRTSEVDAFDPKCNCWHSLASLPVAINDSSGVTVGKTFYVLGGTDGKSALQDVYAFDGAGWVKRDDLRLPEPRIFGSAVTDGHRIYILSGLSDPNDYSSGLKSVWSIDPMHASKGWQRLPECSCEARATAGAAVLFGSLYLIGGLRAKQGTPENLDDIWSLDLKTQRWKLVGKLPEARRALWAASDEKRILIFGGYTDRFCSDVLAIENGEITHLGDLAEPVAAAGFVQIDGQWLTAGGETGVHVRGSATWSGTFAP
jgi:N-acetylneuraminic acid mutarotase